MSDAIRATVAQILKTAGVAYGAIYRGEKTRDGWKCDAWECTFTRARGIRSSFAPRAGGDAPAREEFDYFTGLGHRKPDDSAMARMSAKSIAKVSKRMLIWEQHYRNYPDKPQAPHAADVLHSLILDSSAVGQSFESWCGEYGYDSDSRKAENIYRECQQNADKLQRVLPRDVLAQISETLQDY